MPPPNKKIAAKGKIIKQSYLNSLDKENDGPSVIAVDSSGDEEDMYNSVTYHVDDECRYYNQQAGDNQSLVTVLAEVKQVNEEISDDTQVLVDGKSYQTVTLVPSETGNSEVSYMLVMQDENKQVLKVDPQEKNNDVYTFEEGEEDGSEPSDEPVMAKTSTSKRKKHLLQRHLKSHYEDRPYTCEICERGFKTVICLRNHLNMHNGIKPYICKYCNSPFTTSGELVRHVRYRHTLEKRHKCTECDYACVELSKLRRHIRCHTGERPYQCPHCTYASQDTFKLKRHLRIHTGEKPYKCENCNMRFTQSNSLKAHKRIHNVSEKPLFTCELCPVKCSRKNDLRIHMKKLHTSDKPLKCKKCGKSLPDRYSYKVHNKTHKGEKCFKCELCPYASTTLRLLKSHVLCHSDEKPFVCDLCDQSFRQKQLLRRHQNLHHNPNYEPKPPKEKTHTCHECKRTFVHNGNLIRHLAMHDPESGYQERNLALKLGRQRQIKTLDVDMKMDGLDNEAELTKIDPSDNELKGSDVSTVGDGERQQYMVFKVVQLEDGAEQHFAVVIPDYMEKEKQEEKEEEKIGKEEEEENMMVNKQSCVEQEKQKNYIKFVNDVDTFFGFDEDEDEEEESPIVIK